MKPRPSILALAPQVPRPDRASGDRRFFALLQMMAREADVTLSAGWNGPLVEDQPYIDKLAEAGVQVAPRRLPNVSRALLDRYYDAIWFEFPETLVRALPRVRALQRHALKIVDSVDLHFDREWSAVAVGALDRETAARNEEVELAAYRSADVVAVVSELDKKLLASREFMPEIRVLPNVVPIRQRPNLERRREILFVGGFLHQPNVDGLCWFAKEIWPQILTQVPDAVLTVVGSHPPAEVLKLGETQDVTIAGFVPDTGPYLDRAMVSVAPLRFGGGMKGKVNEAMAAGLPVVTTKFGVQGIGGHDAEHYIVADDSASFATAVVSLLEDQSKARMIGLAAQDYVASKFTPEAVNAEVLRLLKHISESRQTSWPRLAWEIRSFVKRPLLQALGLVLAWKQ